MRGRRAPRCGESPPHRTQGPRRSGTAPSRPLRRRPRRPRPGRRRRGRPRPVRRRAPRSMQAHRTERQRGRGGASAGSHDDQFGTFAGFQQGLGGRCVAALACQLCPRRGRPRELALGIEQSLARLDHVFERIRDVRSDRTGGVSLRCRRDPRGWPRPPPMRARPCSAASRRRRRRFCGHPFWPPEHNCPTQAAGANLARTRPTVPEDGGRPTCPPRSCPGGPDVLSVRRRRA